MFVTYGCDAVRRQAMSLVSARPEHVGEWAQRTLLTLVGAADELQDLATTASLHLVRLSSDPLSCFRYANAQAAIYLYPVHPDGQPMRTDLGAEPQPRPINADCSHPMTNLSHEDGS